MDSVQITRKTNQWGMLVLWQYSFESVWKRPSTCEARWKGIFPFGRCVVFHCWIVHAFKVTASSNRKLATDRTSEEACTKFQSTAFTSAGVKWTDRQWDGRWRWFDINEEDICSRSWISVWRKQADRSGNNDEERTQTPQQEMAWMTKQTLNKK